MHVINSDDQDEQKTLYTPILCVAPGTRYEYWKYFETLKSKNFENLKKSRIGLVRKSKRSKNNCCRKMLKSKISIIPVFMVL